MMRVCFSILLLLGAVRLLAAGDSLLWAGVRQAGLTYGRGEIDSAGTMAMQLLPTAHDTPMAEAMLHILLGMVCSSKDEKQEAIEAFGRSIRLAEEHDLLSEAARPGHQFFFSTMIPTYVQQAMLCEDMGLGEQALASAKSALLWMEHCGDAGLCARSMLGVADVLVRHGEYEMAYEPTRRALKWCASNGLHDIAKGLLATMVTIEAFIAPSDLEKPIVSLSPLVADSQREDTAARVPYSLVAEQGATIPSADSTARPRQPEPVINIEYVWMRDRRVGYAIMVLSASLLLFLLYMLWQRRQRKRRDATAAQQLEERFLEGQESERSRLARELHDSISNQLLAVEMKLSSDGLTPQAMQLLNDSREQIRRVSHELLSPEFEHATLNQVVANYAASMDGVNGCSVSSLANPITANWQAIPAKTALEVYRIIQEMVSNTLKHANATAIAIGLNLDEELLLTLTVSDNGIWKVQHATSAKGIGLRTVSQRVAAIHGQTDFCRHKYGNTMKLTVDCAK